MQTCNKIKKKKGNSKEEKPERKKHKVVEPNMNNHSESNDQNIELDFKENPGCLSGSVG